MTSALKRCWERARRATTRRRPILRGVAARAPYFHNGFAKDLDAAVDFYNERFGLGLTDAEHDDLVAFLLTL